MRFAAGTAILYLTLIGLLTYSLVALACPTESGAEYIEPEEAVTISDTILLELLEAARQLESPTVACDPWHPADCRSQRP